MDSLLISGCLIGHCVRYDGKALTVTEPILLAWMREGRLVPICPEIATGMGVPRPPAEIVNGDGHAVWTGAAVVVDKTGRDVSHFFKQGAQAALTICRRNNLRIAVLAESSPSCGSSKIYDGSFSRRKTAGVGVTTALLQKNGIQVFSQFNLDLAEKTLQDRCR